MKVGVLDYGMGNLRSVAKALEAAGAEVAVSAERASLESADALCVPGQGIFGRCLSNLESAGLDDFVRSWIQEGRPYLGICLGLQILFESSDERGPVEGLKLFGGRVSRLGEGVRIPHMGWNQTVPGPAATGALAGGSHFYFDHSYAVSPSDAAIVEAWCDHGGRWAAAIRTGSVTGVQFHPEKSGSDGISFLRGWLG